MKIILHLCADIGSDSKYYSENGYHVIRIGKDIGVENYHPPKNVYGVIANPPCTMFSIARSKAKTPRNLKEGMICVKECLRIVWECQYRINEKGVPHKLNFWVIENPATGYLKNYLGKPAYIYEQWQYGGDMRKKTALWGKFNNPIPFIAKEPDFLKNSTSDKRWLHKRGDKRSICPDGFAKAFFISNR